MNIIIETVKDGKRYTLCNEGIKVGDTVYSIGEGRRTDTGWILHALNWKNFNDEESTTVTKLDDYIRTKRGYGNYGTYFKVIKVEEHRKKTFPNCRFISWEWVQVQIEKAAPREE